MNNDELETLGRHVITEGKLRELRDKLGVSSNVQAHMAGVQTTALRSWERGNTIPKRESAIKVGTWYQWVVDRLATVDVSCSDLVHVSVASQVLARSYATIMDMCRAGVIRHVDLGDLGLYLAKEELRRPEGR